MRRIPRELRPAGQPIQSGHRQAHGRRNKGFPHAARQFLGMGKRALGLEDGEEVDESQHGAQQAEQVLGGRLDAPIRIEVFSDFQCPACKRFVSDAERQLKEEYVSKGQVRLVFRHMAFLGNESRWAAEGPQR